MSDYDPNGLREASDGDSAPGAAIASPNLDRYRPYVAHLDMPEPRKTEMLLAMRHIMQSFVDRAFGDDPVQRYLGLGDKRRGKDESAALPVIDLGEHGVGTNLSESFHQHVIGDNRKERDIL